MKYLKRALSIFAGQTLLIGVVILLTPDSGYGQNPGASPNPIPPPLNVKVVNTPSEPVPVTGTVNVGNLGGSPLPVRNVDNPALQPVSITFAGNFEGASFHNPNLYTVPSGKRLVIEDASVRITLAAGDRAEAYLRKSAPATTIDRPLTLTFQVTRPFTALGSLDILVAAEPVRMYLEAGESVAFFAQRSASSGFGSANVNVAGYLIDVP